MKKSEVYEFTYTWFNSINTFLPVEPQRILDNCECEIANSRSSSYTFNYD